MDEEGQYLEVEDYEDIDLDGSYKWFDCIIMIFNFGSLAIILVINEYLFSILIDKVVSLY